MVARRGMVLVPWWERYPGIFLREAESARKLRFHLRIEPSDGDGPPRMVARGPIRVKAARPGEPERWHKFPTQAEYPAGFPFEKLDMRPLDEAIRRRRHQIADGDLCYTQEELAPLDIGDGLERTVLEARNWFRGEVTGRFENEVPATELLLYLEDRSSRVRALFIPAHAMWDAPPPARWGEITIETDGSARGIAIVGSYRLKTEEAPRSLFEQARKTNRRLWKAVNGPNRVACVTGVWFSLDREPRPFRNLAEMEEALAESGVTRDIFRRVVENRLSSDLRRGGWLPIGLEYPRAKREGQDQGPGREWLFVSIEWPNMPERMCKARRLRTGVFWRHYAVLKGIASFPVRPEDLRRRSGSLYPSEPLERAHVVFVGTGALGSTVARALAAAGVGRITMVDPDTMKPGNVMRHEARLPDVGRPKVDAMAQILLETNPYLRTKRIYGTRAERAKFENAMRDHRFPPTLVLALTANRAVEGQVDDAARRQDPPIPVLHASLQAQAQVLRAFVYQAGRTACAYCNQYHAADEASGSGGGYIRIPDEIADEPFYEASCASPAFPGAGNSNALAAHIVVEMALDVLHGRLRDDKSHWVFAGNRVRERVRDFPVEPLCISRHGFAPHPRCPVCTCSILTEDLNAAEREEYDQALARITDRGNNTG